MLPGEPVAVEVTFVDDLAPWVTIWHEVTSDDGVQFYPHFELNRPSAVTNADRFTTLARARRYVFTLVDAVKSGEGEPGASGESAARQA